MHLARQFIFFSLRSVSTISATIKIFRCKGTISFSLSLYHCVFILVLVSFHLPNLVFTMPFFHLTCASLFPVTTPSSSSFYICFFHHMSSSPSHLSVLPTFSSSVFFPALRSLALFPVVTHAVESIINLESHNNTSWQSVSHPERSSEWKNTSEFPVLLKWCWKFICSNLSQGNIMSSVAFILPLWNRIKTVHRVM